MEENLLEPSVGEAGATMVKMFNLSSYRKDKKKGKNTVFSRSEVTPLFLVGCVLSYGHKFS